MEELQDFETNEEIHDNPVIEEVKANTGSNNLPYEEIVIVTKLN